MGSSKKKAEKTILQLRAEETVMPALHFRNIVLNVTSHCMCSGTYSTYDEYKLGNNIFWTWVLVLRQTFHRGIGTAGSCCPFLSVSAIYSKQYSISASQSWCSVFTQPEGEHSSWNTWYYQVPRHLRKRPFLAWMIQITLWLVDSRSMTKLHVFCSSRSNSVGI